MEDSREERNWTFLNFVRQIYLTWDGSAGNDDKEHLLRDYLAAMLTANIIIAFLVDAVQSVPSQRFIFNICFFYILLMSSLISINIATSKTYIRISGYRQPFVLILRVTMSLTFALEQ